MRSLPKELQGKYEYERKNLPIFESFRLKGVMFMKIEINFEGLNKIFCKFGLHRWGYEDGAFGLHRERYGKFRFCLDCNKEEEVGGNV
ncbi:hypothetical protein M0R04_14345 [Candidatus Dojkabacteria bacterium]|jgi:hypothetical protein|nr:hypothetical protein [Candidatus Dojkabacteria bacterium]